MELVFKDISTFDAQNPIIRNLLREIDIGKKDKTSKLLKKAPNIANLEIESRLNALGNDNDNSNNNFFNSGSGSIPLPPPPQPPLLTTVPPYPHVYIFHDLIHQHFLIFDHYRLNLNHRH